MAIVVILGVLIVLAFGALVGGFVIKLMGAGSKGAKPYVADVAIAPGTTVIGTELNDGKVALKLNTPTGEEIVIVDASSGRELGRVRLKPKP
jgi:hypothetical protein